VTLATLSAALALTGVSSAFSIDGLTAIFAGAFWSMIGVLVALNATSADDRNAHRATAQTLADDPVWLDYLQVSPISSAA
jgi:hypothetical protein